MNQVPMLQSPCCTRFQSPVMTYDQYRLLMIQVLQHGQRRSTVEEIEKYYGLCLELEAGFCAVKSEVVRIADRLIKSYRKNGVAFARQSPVHLDAEPADELTKHMQQAPVALELTFVKTGRAIQDFYNLFHAAHDLAAQSLGWPCAMFSTRTAF